MKKGFSKNRHCSKYTYRRRVQRTRKAPDARNRQKHDRIKSLELTQKSFKWSRVATIIQIIDFLVDKLPRLINYIIIVLGMG